MDAARGKKKGGGSDGLLVVVVIALTVVAIRQQLRLPKEDRTWHGTVDVPVPYDFRRPTMARIRSDLWRPQDPRVFVPRTFGVGWTVNLARVLHRDDARGVKEDTRNG